MKLAEKRGGTVSTPTPKADKPHSSRRMEIKNTYPAHQDAGGLSNGFGCISEGSPSIINNQKQEEE